MTDLVTGDAVVLELRLAKLASRALALGIDLLVQVTLLVVGFFVLAGVLDFVDSTLAAALALVFALLIVIGYPVVLETATRGRTLGKLAFGLRVVREDGGPIRFRHAFVRALLAVVEIWITYGVVALVTSLASAKGKRVGDFLAGTVVVRERMPVRPGPVAVMPAPLAGWAAGADLSRLPDDLALSARQFLARQAELAPEVRAALGDRLADAVAAVTAPPPPPGTPSWAFLAAVLAERRRRELGGPPPWPAGTRPAQPEPPRPAGAQPPRPGPPPAGRGPEPGREEPANPFAPPG